MNQSIEFSFECVGELIRKNFLVVPEYQRPYSWTSEHVEELFADFESIVFGDGQEKDYFLGSIVLQPTQNGDGNTFSIVDGQQRLATISLLLAAMKDYFVQHEFKNDAAAMADFLGEWDIVQRVDRAKLKLADKDNHVYRSLVFTKEDSLPQKSKERLRKSQKLLTNAKNIASRTVGRIAERSPDPIGPLSQLVVFIRNHLRVVTVRVSDSANAYRVFETLNDRGLDLASVDLIKNYIFSRAGSFLKEAQESWREVFRQLEAISTEKQHRTFLWDFWKSRNGLVREKQLYDDVSRKINSPADVQDFFQALSLSVELFGALQNPSDSYWSKFNDCPNHLVNPLLTLRLRQNRPLLLAILSKFQPRHVRAALQLVLDAGVRSNVTRELGSQVLEKGYAETAIGVSSGQISVPKELQRALERFIPNDSRFQEEFARCRVKENLARYYLRTLDVAASGSSAVAPSDDTTVVNLEHISSRDSYDEQEDEDAAEFLGRLGNCAILETKVNSKLGKHSFEKKKEAYRKSSFLLTRRVGELESWGPSEIETRQQMLAELAVKVWPMKAQ